MKKSKIVFSSALAIILTLGLSLTSFQSVVAADESDGKLVTKKTATLQEDGTYRIDLEAYATGTVKKETKKEVTPTDIVLVLDQSGSMSDSTISGIPSGYVEATPTHEEAMKGDYYYKVGESYYRVNVTREQVESTTKWIGQDGKEYTDDQLSYSWTRKCDGQVYNTATPFVTSSLKTYTRTHSGSAIQAFWYVNDENSDDTTKKWYGGELSAASARNEFTDQKKKDSTTVEFHNDGAPSSGDTSIDDLYYVAAVYTAVSRQTVNTYEYTYTYTDAAGKTVEIGKYQGTDSDKATETLYKSGATTDGVRLDALKYSANKFINDIRQNALANSVDHRIAVVGFATNDHTGDYYYSNTELFIGGTQYNYAVGGTQSTYNTAGNLAEDHYEEAFQSAGTNTGYNNLIASVNALAGYGATYPSNGFKMAQGIFENNTSRYTKADGTVANRKRIVIFLTDGEPGWSSESFEEAEANETVALSSTLQTSHNTTVYTVAVLDKAPTSENSENFLKNTSTSGSYTLATSTKALDGFFESVTDEIESTETSVTLDKDAVISDTIGDDFMLPDGFSVNSNVKIQIANHTGYESFAQPTSAPDSVKATVTDKTISVTGFDFTSEENLVTTDETGGSVKATGNKVLITITGVLAKDSAATGNYVSTNTASSGVYGKDEEGNTGLVQAFEQPMFQLTKNLYVLDYAKEAELSIANIETATRVDGAEDLIFSKVDENNTVLQGMYGNTAVESNKLTYTPRTMQWNGYDTFYALGKSANKYNWAKASVIPATSVYYEDSFETNESTGTVGIQYSKEGWEVVTNETANANKEDANGNVQGWIEDLSNDSTYSDGSAHYSTTSQATATFTFTGSGVDIYSRTDMETGLVKAQLYTGTTTDTIHMTKSYIIDNESVSGAYYQIPTASFCNLENGTYTVKLTVVSNTANPANYYLDGIRVYNPISAEQADKTVNTAYSIQDMNADAVFTSVREMLLDSNSFGQTADGEEGVVFIDKNQNEQTGTTTSKIAEYKDYGPKNEVYLASNQAVVFTVYGATDYYIGLKAPEGATNVAFTNGDQAATTSITGASDLYYKVVPNKDGMVEIKNTGDKLLSITKFCASGFDSNFEEEASLFSRIDPSSAVTYADTFELLESQEYTSNITNPDIDDNENTGDVDIDNGGDVSEDEETSSSNVKNWIEKLFAGIRGWFGR